MRLGTYKKEQNRGDTEETYKIYMVGENYRKRTCFERLVALLPLIEAKARRILNGKFLRIEVDEANMELRLFVEAGTTFGSHRQDFAHLQGWLAYFATDTNTPANPG